MLAASLALFATIASVHDAGVDAADIAAERETARIVSIAMKARADGRPEHADALLASVASRPAKDRAFETASGTTLDSDSVQLVFVRSWLPSLALVIGLLGGGAVLVAVRRRRRVFNLISAEIAPSSSTDDPGTLIGALFRLRAERSMAQFQLENVTSRLEQAMPHASPRSRIEMPSLHADATPTSQDTNAGSFHDFGRIIEITSIAADGQR